MAIRKSDMLLGAAINRIASSTTFTQVNRISESKDLYAINDAGVLFHVSTKDAKKWHFVVTRDDLEIPGMYDHSIAFICGSVGVVSLKADSLQSMARKNASTIKVDIVLVGRGRFLLSIPGKKSASEILDVAFPNNLFDIISDAQDRVFCWPPLSQISLFDENRSRFVQTYNRRLDLADSLGFMDMSAAYIGISTIAPDWKVWDEERLKIIEDHIAYDLEFDGFEVSVSRDTDPTEAGFPGGGMPCNEEFVWKIDFLNSYGEEGQD